MTETKAFTAFTLALAMVFACLTWRPFLATFASAPSAANLDQDVEEPSAAVINAPAPTELHSVWHAQSNSPDVELGDVAEITIQYWNAGAVTWTKDSLSEVRLGETGDPRLPSAMRVDWPYWDRPAVQSELAVGVGDLVTFSVKVKGVKPGQFRLRVRPVIDGVAWLDDEGAYVDINVRA